MTLLEFLADLPARPGEASSPKLLVREDDLGEFDADEIILVDPYARAPYAILVGLSRVPQVHTHHSGVKTSGALDVTLFQPTTTAGELPDPVHMARLAALIVRAPETDPVAATPGNPLRGRVAAIRFQYSIWR